MIPECIKKVLRKIETNGFEAYIVGGFVRDFLLFKKTNDIDIATNARPKDLIAIFGLSKRKIEYGSYHLKIDNYNIDITTYRKEVGYEKGRPIKIIYSDNLIEDAKRRDFTINAMYLNERGNLLDLYNGQEDLKNKTLRMIGNPLTRLKEDPIRILRAVRFSVIYHLKLDKALKTAIQKEKKNIKTISLNKIRKELDPILLGNGFNVLKKLGILSELGITTSKIVYVEDISGLWAQLKTNINYTPENSLQINQKNITKIINCGTIELSDLYKYGFYLCRVAAIIIHFPLAKLARMVSLLPIKSRRDIAITPEEIQKLTGLTGKELGQKLVDLEIQIINLKVKNEKEEIINYLERRSK